MEVLCDEYGDGKINQPIRPKKMKMQEE